MGARCGRVPWARVPRTKTDDAHASRRAGVSKRARKRRAAATEGLIQNAINTGEVLLLISLTGVDDIEDDPCLDLEVNRAEGSPLLGSDGKLLDHQSFEINPELFSDTVEHTALTDGRVTARPLTMNMPINVLSESLMFNMHNGGIAMNLDADGTASGFFGGAIPLDTLFSAVDFDQIEGSEFFMGLLAGAADLEPDENGECQAMSVAFEFHAQPAFIMANDDSD